jgi:hypothetical protein
MAMSEINTFMSHGAVNEDAESSERERGAWSVVAWSQRDGSGNYIGARARPFAATSVPLCGARTYDSACAPGWRTVSTGDIQDSPRRACTIARLFSQQRFVPKRNCHPRSEEVLDLDAATPAAAKGIARCRVLSTFSLGLRTATGTSEKANTRRPLTRLSTLRPLWSA